MNDPAELDRLTAALAEAAKAEDWSLTQRLLDDRRDLLAQTAPPAPDDPGRVLAQGRRAIDLLSRRRDELREQLARMRQARGRLESFHPARTAYHRLNVKI